VERGFINYPFLTTHDRCLEGLREDDACRELLQDVQRRWQTLAW
jgi:hypothetical protein